MCGHDLDIGGTSVAADADGYFNLGFEYGEDSEVARVDKVKEGPELDEVVLEGGTGENDSVMGLLDRLLAENKRMSRHKIVLTLSCLHAIEISASGFLILCPSSKMAYSHSLSSSSSS